MKDIVSWSPEYKEIQMKKIKHITEFNQKHFFSEEFFNTEITELKDNLIPAFENIENTNIGLIYRDLKIKNIPGMRQHRKNHNVKSDRLNALKKIKEYRKRNRKIVK
jgi:hypothetical protein